MIACDGHRPGVVAGVEGEQKARRVVDVAAGVEHLGDILEFPAVVVMVDLHAADVDPLRAAGTGSLERRKCLPAGPGVGNFSTDIQCVRLQAATSSGFGKPDCVEDAERNPIPLRRTQNLGLAGIFGFGSLCPAGARYTRRQRRDRCCQQDRSGRIDGHSTVLLQGAGHLLLRRHWPMSRRSTAGHRY